MNSKKSYFDALAPDEFAQRDLYELLPLAAQLRDQIHGQIITYSRKVFVPLTRLCRDVCHYCTFATTPKPGESAYLSKEEVIDIARAGQRMGCSEVLFTLGDKPELRYQSAREQLSELGYSTTIEYLTAMCQAVVEETGLLPHANPGVMSEQELAMLRLWSVSQGIMLESASRRLCEKGQVHYGSPDKDPALRLDTIRTAGKLSIPFTTGILIGIGETRTERIESLLALRTLHEEYGHIQEIIIQNFRAKAATKCAGREEPDLADLMWTIAAARIIFGAEMNIQAPPNLSPHLYPKLMQAGLNDWGGVSPVTPDHVNPEAPWPQLTELRESTAQGGKELQERMAIYPSYVRNLEKWVDPGLRTIVLRESDSEGYPRMSPWSPGLKGAEPPTRRASAHNTRHNLVSPSVRNALALALDGQELSEEILTELFHARGSEFDAICEAADTARRDATGDVVRYVVTRNINYTNVCQYKCAFCAFSKGKHSAGLRGPAYDLDIDEVVRRAREARVRGASEVCLQGGIHPGYTGDTYLDLVHAIKDAEPGLHIHAFSPLEINHGANTLGLSLEQFLTKLRDAGLGSLPGTAAEILHDDVRAIICPDKLNTQQWIDTVETAHRVGLHTTSTMMFGHVDRPRHWSRHLVLLRELQQRTGGISEFVPLPFVHMEAPIYYKGLARKGPTYRETILVHALGRLALHRVIPNIQVSWVKLGAQGAKACLEAGANDLGGTLMNESISNAAGTEYGQEMNPAQMDNLIMSIGRVPRQRTTLYGVPSQAAIDLSYQAPPLDTVVLTPAGKFPTNKCRSEGIKNTSIKVTAQTVSSLAPGG
ncbi:5-amino-6-(D-ribitylamino)uracil--L-tyrosine 4-hydroxyphenyl transferase CofH [Pollutimonas sp. H1-120]|uniref:5-amino-6-(D-ribitylamino)uracil--L-tyrosine 4-hydroxyphenyl transferase CofH n=1 Tax=Pollutimonas sp. H1-120 TaxID=3148824 RepID=UPI003B51C628